MIWIISFVCVCLCCLWMPVQADAATDTGESDAPPMVKKHIFLPERPPEDKAEAVSTDALMAKIEFTGVIISPKGRYAMIKEKARPKDGTFKKIYQEGEDIAGATILRIAANHLVLKNQGEEVTLRLYSGNRKRPAPVKVAPPPKLEAETPPAQDQAAAQSAQGDQKKAQQGTGIPKPGTGGGGAAAQGQAAQPAQPQAPPNVKTSNPFAEALRKAIEKKQSSTPAAPAPATNPFLEAIKRAQQKQ